MTVTDLQLAGAVNNLYNDSPAFDDILWPAADDGVCVALRRIGDDDIVVFRGSVTAQDWARDFLALPHETEAHPTLGDVHAGFMLGMDAAYAHVVPLLRSSVYVTGHSLGAGRATLFTGLLVAAGRTPIGRVVFGEPRSGCADLAALVNKVGVNRSYRNADPTGRGHDLVTDVPTDPPFEHAVQLTDIFGKPADDDPWLLLKYHHLALYIEGLNSP
jgi:hypothetical protein